MPLPAEICVYPVAAGSAQDAVYFAWHIMNVWTPVVAPHVLPSILYGLCAVVLLACLRSSCAGSAGMDIASRYAAAPWLQSPLLLAFAFAVALQNAVGELLPAEPGPDASAAASAAAWLSGVALGPLPLLLCAVALLAFVVAGWLTGGAARVIDTPSARRPAEMCAMLALFTLIVLSGVLSRVAIPATPTAGPAWLLYGFEALVIGGAPPGTKALPRMAAGGIVLGLAQLAAEHWLTGFGPPCGHLLCLAMLAWRTARPRRAA